MQDGPNAEQWPALGPPGQLKDQDINIIQVQTASPGSTGIHVIHTMCSAAVEAVVELKDIVANCASSVEDFSCVLR